MLTIYHVAMIVLCPWYQSGQFRISDHIFVEWKKVRNATNAKYRRNPSNR